MTFDDPGDEPFFDHLDDPAPPIHGAEAITHVIARGQQIRRRRRAMYSASSLAIVVIIAGAAVGIGRGGGPNNSQTIQTAKSPTSTESLVSPRPKHDKSHGSGGITQTTGPSGQQQQSTSGGPTTPASTACASDTPTIGPTSPDGDSSNAAIGEPRSGSSAPTSPSPSPTPTPTCSSMPPQSTPPASPTTSTTPSVSDSASDSAS